MVERTDGCPKRTKVDLTQLEPCEKPYNCDECDYVCTTSGALTKHKRKHTGEKPFNCDQCDYVCLQSTHLTTHKRMHTGEKPFKCDHCDFACSRSTHLTTHKRIHTGEKPFKCDHCDFACVDSSGLTTHKRVHTGEKPFKCDQCYFACADGRNLTKHKRIHTGEKPFKCDHCDFACTTSSGLTTHKRIHTGEKPFNCDQCDYVCLQSTHLTTHKRIHTGEKPFKCDHCSKAFSLSPNRTRHHKKHEEQKSYQFACTLQDGGMQPAQDGDVKCTIRCKTGRDLDYHIQRHHTPQGIAAKFKSEQQLADFFTSQQISYDRDWLNFLTFKLCSGIEGGKSSARPDFYLHAKSAELGCVFLVCNDEFAHRQTKCEFQRVFNITHALQQTTEFKDLPVVFVRFNPHFFRVDGKLFDLPIDKAHLQLLNKINSIQKQHLQKGVNIVFVNYDKHENIFNDAEEGDYATLFRSSVLVV